MSFGASYDTKQRVKEAIDIVELVGDYIPLRRQGRGYRGLCPWHDDTRPSLQVNPDRQSFKCWVCDIGGDVFSFMMKTEGVTFPEALAMLADRAGIRLAPTPSGSSAPEVADERRSLYRVLAWAEREYHQFLTHAPAAQSVRRYVAERRISDQSVARFRLGFAPDRWDWLIEKANSSGVDPKLLERTGLVARRQQGSGCYDRFKGRLLFSIRDAQGRPVGFGGRSLPGIDSASPAKYINSPETPLFSKSKLLYGLDVARDAMRSSRTAVVVEGYTDCIMAHQHGVANVVAVLGTALGEQHIRLLRRYADRIILVLDGDEAGKRRAGEILELFVAAQMDLRVLTLPENVDPCDLLLERGGEAFREQLQGAADALEHKIRLATEGLDVDDTHAAHQALEDILNTISKAPRLGSQTAAAARIKEDQILHRLARRFGVSEERLRARLSELRNRSRSRGQARAEGPSASTPGEAEAPPVPQRERELLELVILEPGSLAAVRETVDPSDLEHPWTGRVFRRCCELSDAGETVGFGRLLLEFDEPELKDLLVDLDEKSRMEGKPEFDLRLRDVIDLFRRRRADRQHRAAAAALQKPGLAEQEELEVLDQIIRSQRNRQGISAPTEG